MKLFQLVTILFILLGTALPSLGAEQVDHSLYGDLLASHVRDGLVDYQGLKQDEARLDSYLDLLARVDPGVLDREERFAFYINLYNAWTLKLILMHWPAIESIKDAGSLFSSPWSKDLVRLKGELVTLDHIEHDILRPEFQDYRVHAAVNCSAMSCPPLLPVPFEGDRLEEQLEQAFTAFVNNPNLNRVEHNELRVSKIFSWFEEDFTPDVVSVVRQYAGPELSAALDELGEDPDLGHLGYDWSLNRQ